MYHFILNYVSLYFNKFGDPVNIPIMNCKKYIIRNGRTLPIFKCLIGDGYEEQGLTQCLIIRKQPGGKFTFAFFMVDRLCLGVKNAFVNCNFTEEQIEDLIEKVFRDYEPEEVTPAYFHNLVYGAIDYAGEFGLKPHKDFGLAEYILDPDLIDDGIDEIEMGLDGKPFFISGPYDNVQKILNALDRTVGEGNYTFITRPEDLD